MSKNSYIEVGEALDVLDILRAKEVSVFALGLYETANKYNNWRNPKRHLTEEEFEICKRWYNSYILKGE